MVKIVKIVFIISIITFSYSFWQKTKLPPRSEILDLLYQEPSQTEVTIKLFEQHQKDFNYQITPKYDYEIYGLIVSSYDSENWLDFYHQKDPLNTKDICLVWGENLSSGAYEKAKFRHGEFTCYVNYGPGVRFSFSHFSNNHLLPKNEEIHALMKKAVVGDQVLVRGYLVNYSTELPDGKKIGTRLTSTVREDIGDGACEVIYVNDFEILKKGNVIYSYVNLFSQFLIVFSLGFFLISIPFPRKSSNKIIIRDRRGRFSP